MKTAIESAYVDLITNNDSDSEEKVDGDGEQDENSATAKAIKKKKIPKNHVKDHIEKFISPGMAMKEI
jgi:hypothetical protein